jgi:hypothetical protein
MGAGGGVAERSQGLGRSDRAVCWGMVTTGAARGPYPLGDKGSKGGDGNSKGRARPEAASTGGAGVVAREQVRLLG